MSSFEQYYNNKMYSHNIIYINKLVDHLQFLNNINQINLNTYNENLEKINEITINLNTLYKNLSSPYKTLHLEKLFNNKSYLEIFDIINSHNEKYFNKNNIKEFYKKYKIQYDSCIKSQKITNIINTIGLPTISETLKYYNIKINYDILEILEPLSIPIKIEDNIDYTFINKEWSPDFMNDNLFIDYNEINLSKMNYNIYIKNSNNKYFVITCVLKDNSFRIINNCDEIKYRKEKILALHANTEFKKLFVQNAFLIEFLLIPIAKWKKYLDEYSTLYIKLNNMTHDQIISYYNNHSTDMNKIIQIIRVLLYNNNESINISAIIYHLTKTKKDYNVSFYINMLPNKHLIDMFTVYAKLSIEPEQKVKKTASFKKMIISTSTIPDNIKKLVNEKIDEIKNMSTDIHKQQLYIKTLLNYPWYTPDVNYNIKFIQDIDIKLKDITYGQEKAKEQISLQLAKLVSNKSSSGFILGLHGPPGVGKTLLAKNIADIIGMPFINITLGGNNDSSVLIGHSYTYSGSQPGIIIKKIVENKTTRCVLYLDELDKTSCKSGEVNDITNILIHLTDATSKCFQDRFFDGIDFNLENLFIIASYNDRSKIDPILLDRFTEMELKGYTVKDKVLISRNYLIPSLCKSTNLNININISDLQLQNIIINYTNEAGVRSLKRHLEQIILKINKKILLNEIDPTYNIELSDSDIVNYIGTNIRNELKINDINFVGVVNGLYATSTGVGGITIIQIQKNYTSDKFDFKLTGNQGKVMQESVYCSYTCAVNYLLSKDPNILKHIKENFSTGFHVHYNDYTAKDGPSSSIGLATCFISLILNKPVNRKIAMTGEINLLGEITKIGGLSMKLHGAKIAKVEVVIISHENLDDIAEIIKDDETLFDDNFKYISVKHISDVIDYAFS